MEDFKEASIWHLMYKIRYGRDEEKQTIDPYLANKITYIGSLYSAGLAYAGDIVYNAALLPLTVRQIKQVIFDDIAQDKYDWKILKAYIALVDNNIIKIFAEAWLKDGKEFYDFDGPEWFINIIQHHNIVDRCTLLTKMLSEYKNSKTQKNIKIINKIFSECPKEEIIASADIINNSTNAVRALLLTRAEMLPESYVIAGLKAMSNLTRQRAIDFKIKFSSLECLGPRGRLDAMKQLLGALDEYFIFMQNDYDPNSQYSWWQDRKKYKLKRKSKAFNIPFETMPTREEVEKFLFPCALKYNDEVVLVMKRYDEITEIKEKEDVNSSN